MRLKRIVTTALIATVLCGATIAPANAQTMKTATTATCAGQPLAHSGSSLRYGHLYYQTVDGSGTLRFFDIYRQTSFDWCTDIDGDRFIRVGSSAFTHRTTAGDRANNVVAAHSAPSAYIGAYPDKSIPIYQPVIDHAWINPGVSADNFQWASLYKWQYSDSRWINDFMGITVRLSPGQRFSGCKCYDGKWVYTFDTSLSYY